MNETNLLTMAYYPLNEKRRIGSVGKSLENEYNNLLNSENTNNIFTTFQFRQRLKAMIEMERAAENYLIDDLGGNSKEITSDKDRIEFFNNTLNSTNFTIGINEIRDFAAKENAEKFSFLEGAKSRVEKAISPLKSEDWIQNEDKSFREKTKKDKDGTIYERYNRKKLIDDCNHLLDFIKEELEKYSEGLPEEYKKTLKTTASPNIKTFIKVISKNEPTFKNSKDIIVYEEENVYVPKANMKTIRDIKNKITFQVTSYIKSIQRSYGVLDDKIHKAIQDRIKGVTDSVLTEMKKEFQTIINDELNSIFEDTNIYLESIQKQITEERENEAEKREATAIGKTITSKQVIAKINDRILDKIKTFGKEKGTPWSQIRKELITDKDFLKEIKENTSGLPYAGGFDKFKESDWLALLDAYDYTENQLQERIMRTIKPILSVAEQEVKITGNQKGFEVESPKRAARSFTFKKKLEASKDSLLSRRGTLAGSAYEVIVKTSLDRALEELATASQKVDNANAEIANIQSQTFLYANILTARFNNMKADNIVVIGKQHGVFKNLVDKINSFEEDKKQTSVRLQNVNGLEKLLKDFITETPEAVGNAMNERKINTGTHIIFITDKFYREDTRRDSGYGVETGVNLGTFHELQSRSDASIKEIIDKISFVIANTGATYGGIQLLGKDLPNNFNTMLATLLGAAMFDDVVLKGTFDKIGINRVHLFSGNNIFIPFSVILGKLNKAIDAVVEDVVKVEISNLKDKAGSTRDETYTSFQEERDKKPKNIPNLYEKYFTYREQNIKISYHILRKFSDMIKDFFPSSII